MHPTTIKHFSIVLALLALIGCCIPFQSQQQFGVAVGSGNNDVIKHEYYEYNPAGANGYNHRPASPFSGVLPGIILVIASSALQWYNEGRAVRDAKMLSRAERQVVELDPISPFDEKNDGKLVHITGDISTEGGLYDSEHGMHRPDALQLVRTTEAYLWKEEKSTSRRRVSQRETKVQVSYRYNKQWSTRHIDSNRFQSPNHYNPYPRYNPGRSVLTATDARISNGLHVPPDLVNQIGHNNFWQSGKVFEENIKTMPPINLISVNGLHDNHDSVILANENKLYFSERKSQSELLASGLSQPGAVSTSSIPIVRSSPRPEVGDIKISWTEVIAPVDGVSILAKQEEGRLVPWTHDNNNGHTLYTLFPGKFTAQSMIAHLMGRSKLTTKILRIGGWIGNFIGLNLVLSCIPALVKLLPFGLGHFLVPLVSLATSTIALGASTGLSFSVISVAWLRFRPIFAACLAIVSGVGFLGPFYYARWKRSAEVFEMDEVLKAEL